MPYETSVPFRAGSEGYASYRIPACVLAPDGALLAFAEGRVDSSGDAGHIDIVSRRSTDGGLNWEEMQVVAEFGDGTAGNPSPVVLPAPADDPSATGTASSWSSAPTAPTRRSRASGAARSALPKHDAYGCSAATTPGRAGPRRLRSRRRRSCPSGAGTRRLPATRCCSEPARRGPHRRAGEPLDPADRRATTAPRATTTEATTCSATTVERPGGSATSTTTPTAGSTSTRPPQPNCPTAASTSTPAPRPPPPSTAPTPTPRTEARCSSTPFQPQAGLTAPWSRRACCSCATPTCCSSPRRATPSSGG